MPGTDHDPYISGNGCTPAKAELVWQDAMNLVTDIKYNADSNGGNISFKVDRSSIRQGNAVIAIKDVSDAILWLVAYLGYRRRH